MPLLKYEQIINYVLLVEYKDGTLYNVDKSVYI